MEYKAGMFIYALAFLVGNIIVQQFKFLPDSSIWLIVLAVTFFLLAVLYILLKQFNNEKFRKELTLIISVIILILIDFLYSSYVAKQQLSKRLDTQYIGKNLLVTGHVSNLPVTNGRVQRFTFDVDNVYSFASDGKLIEQAVGIENFPNRLRLSWYYAKKVNASESWQLEVRLKPPHGFMNPGGFDYESWLFQHSIGATGYVRKSVSNQRLAKSIENFSLSSINVYRQSIAQRIDSIAEKRSKSTDLDNSEINAFSIIKALAIGDKSSISKDQWLVLINTGTSHLMAISGLHIGLAALFAYALVRRLVPSCITKRFPAQHVALIAGMAAALMYALVAGLAIPTQRAIIMLFAASTMMLLRHNYRPVDVLGFALLAVLIVDPLAVLAVGFWFSFAAVAVIFFSIRMGVSNRNVDDSRFSRIIAIVKGWVILQLVISIFLLPPSLFMFQQVSLISPLANLLLIPYISFLVVPVVLLAIVFTFISIDLAENLFSFSAAMIDWIWPMLNYFSVQPYAIWVQGELDVLGMLLLIVMIIFLFIGITKYDHDEVKRLVVIVRHSVKSMILIISGLLITAVYFLNEDKLKSGEYKVTVLDVGQGSAAVLQTQKHTLIFDTGAKFSEKLDAGRSVVIPYLRTQGIKTLDYVIVSHGDIDHIGGAESIIDQYSHTTVIGQGIGKLNTEKKVDCHQGNKWVWDGVEFEFFSTVLTSSNVLTSMLKRNNRSCVLKVSSIYGSVLFTGDIEKKVEKKLLGKYKNRLNSDVLIVPHHGSNTSSSAAFITAVKPEIAIFSVGYKNKYKLPSNKIVNRYRLAESKMYQTAKSGAIEVNFTRKTGMLVKQYREDFRKYWNHIVGQ